MSAPLAVLADAHVLITGVAGTVGRALLRRSLASGAARITGLDLPGAALEELSAASRCDHRVALHAADVRDFSQLHPLFEGVDHVFHAAAYKDVRQCERDAATALRVNVQGTENVFAAARRCAVKRVVFLSTDKAVHPTSVMGATKLIAERLVAEAQAAATDAAVFTTVRFGNIAGSSGSVVPLFRQQAELGGPLTLTDDRMTRFMMGLDDAVSLVLTALSKAVGGEVFIPKMSAVRIADLAAVMAMEGREAGAPPVAIVTVGAFAGERLYEALVTDGEADRAVECEGYFVIPGGGAAQSVLAAYGGTSVAPPGILRSDECVPLSRAALQAFLRTHASAT